MYRTIVRICPGCLGSKVNANGSGPCTQCGGSGTITEDIEERR